MPFDGDPLGFYGKLIVEAHDASLLEALKSKLAQTKDDVTPTISDDTISADLLTISDDNLALLLNKKVGILGAGIGGLYTALMLDSIGIEYEILEASGRVGGRLETHKFKDGGKYDYYDAGAMRYPLPKKEDGKYKNGIMARLADLIEYGPLNEGDDKLKDQLREYYYEARKNTGDKPGFYYYNGVHQIVGGPKDASGFKAKDMGVGTDYIKAGYDNIQSDVINPFVRALIKDLETGSKDGWAVMLENDAYSVRGYMATKYLPSYSLDLPPRHLPMSAINWVNLLKTGTSRYDRALTEAVFSEMAFANVGENNYGDVDWKCFEGGSETLSKKTESYLKTKNLSFVRLNQKATAIEQVFTRYSIPKDYLGKEIPSTARRTTLPSGVIKIEIEGASSDREEVIYPTVKVIANSSQTPTYEYGHVISTLPLPVLRTVDLRNAGLNTLQKNALRALDYGFSVKIALRFKSPWWTTKLKITGGQSFTDLPIRTIVYPSYGVDSDTPSSVLIASYSWSSDASRLGALASKQDKDALTELVLRNLAEAHKGVNGSNEITYEFLKGELADGENVHVKDWNSDEYTMGAFANFSPGEFGDLYSSLTIPAADGCLHFVGEAVSTRHRWVVGALDSAWRAVDEYLKLTKQTSKLEEFRRLWRGNSEWIAPSTLLESEAKSKHDLIDEHIALLRKAILAGVV